MPRPKGSKNKPKTTAMVPVKRTRKPREKKVTNPLHVGKSKWVRPTHFYGIIQQTDSKQILFIYTEKETAAHELCSKLNAETKKERYYVHKYEYQYITR